MKVIKEGINLYTKKVTCSSCEAELEITPNDCINTNCVAFGNHFLVDCPCCGNTTSYRRDSVSYAFWRRIPTPNEM